MQKAIKVLKTVLKVTLWTVIITLSVVIIAILSSPLWVGPLAANIANNVAPRYTGTDFNVKSISLNIFSGRLVVKECHLANPEGYASPEAFGLSTADVNIAMWPLITSGGSHIEVEHIIVRGLRASYLSLGGTNNFDQIIANATQGSSTNEVVVKQEAKVKATTTNDSVKVIITLVDVADSEIRLGTKVGVLPIPLPSVVIRDIGKDSGGTTLYDAWTSICTSCMSSATSFGSGVSDTTIDAANMTINAAGTMVNTIGDLFGSKKKKKSQESSK